VFTIDLVGDRQVDIKGKARIAYLGHRKLSYFPKEREVLIGFARFYIEEIRVP